MTAIARMLRLRSPECVEDLIAAGDAARDRRDWKVAAARYGEALALRPKLAGIWVQQGHALKEDGQLAAAAAAYRSALSLEPDTADTHLNLGHLLKLRGDLDGAAAAYGRALELEPELADASRELAALQRRRGQATPDAIRGPAPAFPATRRGGRADRMAAASAVARGDAARDDRNWCAAAHAYAEALRANPGLTHIWVQFGHALKENGDPVAAEAAYRVAMERTPADADVRLSLGHALKLQGRLEPAGQAYLEALERAPDSVDILQEVVATARAGARFDPGRLAAALGEPAATPRRPDIGLSLAFDVTDVLNHLRHVRRPTGIQRVQAEIVRALLRAPPEGVAIELCAYSERRRYWARAPHDLFCGLCDMAASAAEVDTPAWERRLLALAALMESADDYAFARGAVLVNLGTSWTQADYFLNIRRAADTAQVRYVPFVHDLIPLVLPGRHTPQLAEDFAHWLHGVLRHADGFLVNSQSTRRDLEAAAARAGRPLVAHSVEVVPLDADARPAGLQPDPEVLRRLGLAAGDFVLFVSTIEGRKNHLAAFDAWRALIDRRGLAAVPRLVCAGARGWMSDAVYQRLETDPELAERVTIVSGLSDAALAALYGACAFTLYPSLYEGWGLPVTEALCHGKATLAARVASLPEAGGDFADYFDLESPDSLIAGLERLLFEPGYRAAREARIRDGFRPRTWADVGRQIVAAVSALPSSPAAAELPRAARDGYLSLARVRTPVFGAEPDDGEALRRGAGWWPAEPWGCWTRPEGAELALRAPNELGLTLYLGLRGVPGLACPYEIEVRGDVPIRGGLQPGETRWIAVPGVPPGAQVRLVIRGRATHVPPGSEGAASLGVIGCTLRAADGEAAVRYAAAAAAG